MDNRDIEKNELLPENGIQPQKRGRELYEWLELVVSTIVVCVLVFMFLVRLMSVDGSSMYPTLVNLDKVLVSDLFYSPKQGDVIVLVAPNFGEEPLVKRVIAVEGQTVDIDFSEGVVYVDGEAQDEPYINELTHNSLNFSGEVTVPEGCVFVMGDNRNASTDSRDSRIGFIDERCILGKVYCVIFPLGHIKLVR